MQRPDQLHWNLFKRHVEKSGCDQYSLAKFFKKDISNSVTDLAVTGHTGPETQINDELIFDSSYDCSDYEADTRELSVIVS